MSTEHASEHDFEYGPTPPGAKHEHTDIDPAVGFQFGLWLGVAMLISFAIVYATFWLFEGQEKAADRAAPRFPTAVGVTRPAPTPALQTQPFKDLHTLRAEEAAQLGTYGWVDKEGGVTRIPVDRAMEVMLQRGFAVRAQGAGDAQNVVTQDSSSGRTFAPR